MMHVRIPDFSEPVPVRTPVERRAARAIALGLHPQALEPARPSHIERVPVVIGEALSAFAIIGGSMVLPGLMSLH